MQTLFGFDGGSTARPLVLGFDLCCYSVQEWLCHAYLYKLVV